jgi:carbonic anhydrase
MLQGKAITEEVQWIVVRMAAMMSEKEISMYTQISTRKVRAIVSYFKSHGDVCCYESWWWNAKSQDT